MMHKRGFTLIELMTSVSVFLIVMTVSMGSIVNTFEANRKARSLKAVMTNLNIAVEGMAKEMRFGSNYHCGSGAGDVTIPQSCPGGDSFFSFLSNGGDYIAYRYINGTIERRIGGGVDWIPIIAPEVTIEADGLKFFTIGAESGGNKQPKNVIQIRGYTGVGSRRTDFVLQTLVSQRFLNQTP